MIEKLVTLVKPGYSLLETARRIVDNDVAYYGLAIVVDDKRRVLGVLNDGDFLRLLVNNADLTEKVETAMIEKPVTVNSKLAQEDIIEDVKRQLRARYGQAKDTVRYVLVVDDDNVLVNVFRYVDLLSYYKNFGEKVAVYGQGFVGLTLAAALSSRGHIVTGLDSNEILVSSLNRGQIHIFEPKLADTINASLENGKLNFKISGSEDDSEIHIIAVGTPADNKGRVNLNALKEVCISIAKVIERGNLVMLRSTVPAGTTRNVVKPILEDLTGFKAGQDFYLAYTPERTVEGNAMSELRNLPQVVGGFTTVCTQKALTFWGTLTDSVINVDSLEAAELVKLLNNSFRDLSFAFSNSFALLCDNYNLDAFQVINAANEGYPRNKIPNPSPGVGGYCLTKDPYLYASIDLDLGHAKLALAGREINQYAAEYPVRVVEKYFYKSGSTLSGKKILIIGMAFKGWPETNDMRGSTSLEVAKILKGKGAKIMGWDAVVRAEAIEKEGIEFVELHAGCQNADVILILNNNPKNTPEGLIPLCKGRRVLIFDGWSLFDQKDVEQFVGLTYATMGYMSPIT